MNRQQELDIIAQRRAGISIRAIANATGVPVTTVADVIKRAGLPVPETVVTPSGRTRKVGPPRARGPKRVTLERDVAAAVEGLGAETVVRVALRGADPREVEPAFRAALVAYQKSGRISREDFAAALFLLGLGGEDGVYDDE